MTHDDDDDHYGSDRSHMGRSILVLLLAMVLAISRVSNNPTTAA